MKTFSPFYLLLLTAAFIVPSSLRLPNASAQMPPQASPWNSTPRLRQYTGRVHLSLAALVISPGKPDGRPWDGTNFYAEGIAERIRRGLHPSLRAGLFRVLSLGGNARTYLSEAQSWTIAGYVDGGQAPDIEAQVLVNGAQVGRASKVSDSYFPRWTGNFTSPIQLSAQSQIVVKVIDRDAMYDDDVGTCLIQGMPWVDEQGNVDGAAVSCQGQVWAMALRIVPLDAQTAVYPRSF